MQEFKTRPSKAQVKYLVANFGDRQTFPTENIWDTLHEFGIYKKDIMKLNMSYLELYEIHCAVKTYHESIKFLKNLKSV